ncbi:bifunctional riboflavin kinase/FAD synthetase [Gynuella sunshinyii]|nr:bifunctional riboflavin kinase/FAD synthetase [Gynuella sunshinyii]
MEIIRGLHNLRARHKGCVLTIGNFDGVHRGHQQILRSTVVTARDLHVKSVVMIFEPQAKEFFDPTGAPARLTGFRDKVSLMEKTGVDCVLVINFNARFRALTAKAFVDDVLVGRLGIKSLIVGDDFRFGCDRSGNFEFLKQMSIEHAFEIKDHSTFLSNDGRISSTLVRDKLAQGCLTEASALLGWDYSISGKVIHGAKLGRTIGVPTANLQVNGYKSALEGVFQVDLKLRGSTYYGVANIGPKPTRDIHHPNLEVHIFDFDEEIYGEHLTIVFRHWLRAVKKFANIDELKIQIQEDIAQARQLITAERVTR